MKIIIASDHAGYELKEYLKENLSEHEITDVGCDSEDRCDYPDFGYKAAEEFVNQQADFGVLVCGSGIGISIAANRNPNIRAAVGRTVVDAKLARQHNDANMVAIGSRFTDRDEALDIIHTFLETEFEGGRHQERVEKLGKLQ